MKTPLGVEVDLITGHVVPAVRERGKAAPSFRPCLLCKKQIKTNYSCQLLHQTRQLFWYTLDCKAVATREIPDMYKPKPNPYLNANPNPTSVLSKFSGKNFTLHAV